MFPLLQNCSDDQTDASKQCTLACHSDQESSILLNCQNSLRIHVFVLCVLLVEEEASESLHSVVELISPKSLSHLLHEVVWPASIHLTMLIFVCFNVLKSLSESCGVEEWVQGVSGCAQHVHFPWNDSSVLFPSQVLVELSLRQILQSLLLLVLSCDKLILQVFQISSALQTNKDTLN